MLDWVTIVFLCADTIRSANDYHPTCWRHGSSAVRIVLPDTITSSAAIGACRSYGNWHLALGGVAPLAGCAVQQTPSFSTLRSAFAACWQNGTWHWASWQGPSVPYSTMDGNVKEAKRKKRRLADEGLRDRNPWQWRQAGLWCFLPWGRARGFAGP